MTTFTSIKTLHPSPKSKRNSRSQSMTNSMSLQMTSNKYLFLSQTTSQTAIHCSSQFKTSSRKLTDLLRSLRKILKLLYKFKDLGLQPKSSKWKKKSRKSHLPNQLALSLKNRSHAKEALLRNYKCYFCCEPTRIMKLICDQSEVYIRQVVRLNKNT